MVELHRHYTGAGMEGHPITTEKLTLYLIDTGRTNRLTADKQIRKGLKRSLEVFEERFCGPSKSLNDIQKLDVTLTICGINKMRTLNAQYRRIDRPTDVLSFPVHQRLRTRNECSRLGPYINLGDILICKEVALRQSREFNISLMQEIIQLFNHGLLHLCGYDHEISKREERLMFKLEDLLAKKIFG